MLVTGSFDYDCRLWDVRTGACVHTLTGHRGEARAGCPRAAVLLRASRGRSPPPARRSAARSSTSAGSSSPAAPSTAPRDCGTLAAAAACRRVASAGPDAHAPSDPAGAPAQVRQGHSDEVLDVVFDATGRRLVRPAACVRPRGFFLNARCLGAAGDRVSGCDGARVRHQDGRVRARPESAARPAARGCRRVFGDAHAGARGRAPRRSGAQLRAVGGAAAGRQGERRHSGCVREADAPRVPPSHAAVPLRPLTLASPGGAAAEPPPALCRLRLQQAPYSRAPARQASLASASSGKPLLRVSQRLTRRPS